MQTEFMRSNGLPYSPLQPNQIDEELRSSLAAVQRFKGDFDGANAVEKGAKDQYFYEARKFVSILEIQWVACAESFPLG